MVSDTQKKQIEQLMQIRQTQMAYTLASSAEEMAMATSKEALAGLVKTEYTVATAQGITKSIVDDYTRNILNGGTQCIERVLTPAANGLVKVTTRQVFVPWLQDMTHKDTAGIINYIGEAERAGIHPKAIAKELQNQFGMSQTRAMTAARTEASKIRNDAISASFEEAGVKFVEYVSAGDDLVRPEHEMRNGKIYRFEDAPYIGEYNCRCLLVPADYKVKYKQAIVEDSQAEYLRPEQLGIAVSA